MLDIILKCCYNNDVMYKEMIVMSQGNFNLYEPILNDQEPSEMTMDQRKIRLKDTIESIGKDKNTRGKIDVNKTIKLVKQVAHRAYKIFKLEVKALGQNASVEDKTAALKGLRDFYNEILLKSNEVFTENVDKMSKFQEERFRKLRKTIQDTGTKIDVNIGESANRDYNWANVNLIGKKDFTAEDFRAFGKKKSPLKKLKEVFKLKNKSAKVHDNGEMENEQFGL